MSELNQPGDQGGLTKRMKKHVATDWDAPAIDANMAAMKRMVDKGYDHFWRKRGMTPPKNDFRELVQSGAREGKMKKGKAV